MKICVYAISKNEEQFVDRWYESMKEADEIYVLDTGSTDNTIKKLKSHNINVKKEMITPWRFDVARNKSLDMVPIDTDICVCTDLDEVFKPGWRAELEKTWNKNTNRCRYVYNWSLDENNKPLTSFMYEKIHDRNNYKWIYPVHEILEYTDYNEQIVSNNSIILNHYPDKMKSRGSYLSLLELSVKENQNNDRNVHYLGREYMYYKKWNECIDTLIKHLSLKTSLWKDERCASMRYISRAYINLNRFEEARMWLDKAMEEAPYLREPYIERALLEYQLNNWDKVKKYCLLTLKITEHKMTYINEIFSWDYTVYDLLSLSEFYLDNIDESIIWIDKALMLDSKNERLINNKKILLEHKKNSQ